MLVQAYFESGMPRKMTLESTITSLVLAELITLRPLLYSSKELASDKNDKVILLTTTGFGVQLSHSVYAVYNRYLI